MFFLLGVVNGGLTALSRVVNAALGARVGSLKGSLVNHVVGALAAGLLVLVGLGTGTLYLSGVPIVYLTGGCIGVLVVAASNYAAARIGVTLLSMLMLTFQILSSAAIDHYGWLGADTLPVTPQRGLGIILLTVGTLIALSDPAPKKAASAE